MGTKYRECLKTPGITSGHAPSLASSYSAPGGFLPIPCLFAFSLLSFLHDQSLFHVTSGQKPVHCRPLNAKMDLVVWASKTEQILQEGTQQWPTGFRTSSIWGSDYPTFSLHLSCSSQRCLCCWQLHLSPFACVSGYFCLVTPQFLDCKVRKLL